jgi:hypothetical protein
MSEKAELILKIAWALGCFAGALGIGYLLGDLEVKEERFISNLEKQLEEAEAEERP